MSFQVEKYDATTDMEKEGTIFDREDASNAFIRELNDTVYLGSFEYSICFQFFYSLVSYACMRDNCNTRE